METFVLILLFCLIITSTILALYFYSELNKAKEQIKKHDQSINDHNIALVRLVYHVSKEIQDYETTDIIYKKMSKHIDLQKFGLK